MNRPRVSVITPCYNAAATLAATIASLQAQRYRDFEWLLIDDGSSDDSAQIARDLGAALPAMQVIESPHAGVSAVRNLGIARARGEYLAFLDADDCWAADKLEQHVNHLDRARNVGVSFSRCRFLQPDGTPTQTVSSGKLTELQASDLLYENPTTTTSSLVVRRTVFTETGGFSEDMSFAEDLEWLCRVLCQTRWQIEGLDQALVDYRTSRNGLSAQLHRMQEGWERLIARIARYAPEMVAQHERSARACHLRYLARRSVRLGLPGDVGWQFMLGALRSDWRFLLREPKRSLATLAATAVSRVFGTVHFRTPDSI